MEATLEYIVNHVFLPPKLPQENDQSTENDAALCQRFYALAMSYRERVPDEQKARWNPIVKMLEKLYLLYRTDMFTKEKLVHCITEMRFGDVTALLIRAQNAGVIIRKYADRTVFESFEVSPSNTSVIQTEGRLICSYPGPAIAVPSETANDPAFIAELANFLAHMNVDELDDAIPKTTKARSNVPEIRDTTHPRYITELLTGILRGMGHPEDVTRISKRIADDVLWDNALLPWRRSPLWLVIRVALQTTLRDSVRGHGNYKEFMIFAMAQILSCAEKSDSDSDLLSCMHKKLARRLYKLGDGAPQFLVDAVQRVGTEVQGRLEERWKRVQEEHARGSGMKWDPDSLDIERDTHLTLTNSRPYILKAMKGGHSRPTPKAFQLTHYPRFRTLDEYDPRTLEAAIPQNQFIALADFEGAVQNGIDEWVEGRLMEESACSLVAGWIHIYSKEAGKVYDGNPEDKSIMFLTLFDLWVALDKLCVAQCPLLGQYSPEIDPKLLEHLLLRRSEARHRLSLIIQYLCQRHQRAMRNTSIYAGKVNSDSFVIRFFASSPPHQLLKERIEDKGQADRQAKRKELDDRNQLHRSLTDEANSLSCEYRTNSTGRSVHARCCRKCSLQEEADNLTIGVYEWPLANHSELEAQATVIELDCPAAFGIWRESTFYLLADVCSPAKSTNTGARVKVELSQYQGLYGFVKHGQIRRITFASATKSFYSSHYRERAIPATEPTVCLNNGLHFQLFDRSAQTWVDNPFQHCNIAPHCTYHLPSGPYRYLQYAVDGTAHTSNEVLANQFDCSQDLTLHEHIAFGSLRSGCLLQWLNILRELQARTLTFRRNEVYMLISQAVLQVGPLSSDGTWLWHREAAQVDFCFALLDQLKTLQSSSRANWSETATLKIIIMVTSQILSWNANPEVHAVAYSLLHDSRRVASDWMQQLQELLQETLHDSDSSNTSDIQLRLSEVAAVCRSVYDVDPNHLDSLLRPTSSQDLATVVRCGFAVSDNTPPSIASCPQGIMMVLERDRRLSHLLEPVLAQRISSNRDGLDEAIQAVWPSYRRGTEWEHLPFASDRWLTSRTAKTRTQVSQPVHLNLLQCQTLIDGKPLGRLPREIVVHPTYKRALKEKLLDVVPADIPGMEFATRSLIYGYQVYFALHDGNLVITANHRSSGRYYELIPHSQFQKDLPIFFVEDYAHWLDQSSREIEFRPLETFWVSSPTNWRISFREASGASTMACSTLPGLLVDIRSRTTAMLSARLDRIETIEYLIIVADGSTLSIELPRFRLTFAMNRKTDKHLKCKSFPGMIIDDDQSAGTFIGLYSQLVLRKEDGPVVDRCVVVPVGLAGFQRNDHHTASRVSIGSARHLRYRKYRIDTLLGRLSSDVSLHSRLYKVLLHAITSSCIPDPLTGRTGMEEALRELGSARCQSFQQFDADAHDILDQIRSLTAVRNYYPSHLQSMQTVVWNNLPPSTQHYDYVRISDSIGDLVHRLEMFHGPAPTSRSAAKPNRSSSHLLKRAAERNAYCHVNESAELSKHIVDSRYTGRDVIVEERRDIELSICANSTLICRRPSRLHTATDLLSLVKKWSDIAGATGGNAVSLSYSRTWMESPIAQTFLPIYELCHSGTRNHCELAFTLCAMAYGPQREHFCNMIATLLAFATIMGFRNLRSPPYQSYDLEHGFEPAREKLLQIAESSCTSFKDSFAADIAAYYYETAEQAGHRRVSTYNDLVRTETEEAVGALITQWPCEEPSSPDSRRYRIVRVDKFMMHVRPLFLHWFHNKALAKHIRDIQAVCDRVRENGPGPGERVTGYVFKSVNALGSSQESAITLRDLVRRRSIPYVAVGQLPASPGPSTGSDRYRRQRTETIPSVHLQSLISELKDRAEPIGKIFGDDLEKSLKALKEGGPEHPASVFLPAHHQLEEFATQCGRHYQTLLVCILDALGPTNRMEESMKLAGLWPRITTRCLLEALSSTSSLSLPDKWADVLRSLACSVLMFQRSQRLLRLACLHDDDGLLRELIAGRTEARIREDGSDWLLIQVDNDFEARTVQIEVATEMIKPSSGRNTALQLNMGEGKSSVIVPMVAATLADGTKLARIIVLRSLSTQMFNLLVERLTGLTNRRIVFIPFSRSVHVQAQQAQMIRELYESCMKNRSILVAQPEHLLSFKLMGIDRLVSSRDGDRQVADHLTQSQRWLEQHSRDILDESDEILHVRYQLIYTVGEQQALEHGSDRWTTVQQVLSLVKKHAENMKVSDPTGIEMEQSDRGNFPRIRILHAGTGIALISLVLNAILAGDLPNCPLSLVPPNMHRTIRLFLCHPGISAGEVRHLETYCKGDALWKTLLLLRGLLAHGILVYVLKDRRWRVDYGLDPSRSKLAVPYRAKDVPSLRAEFGHPDVTILLTCLSYYYGGLEQNDMALCFRYLIKLANPKSEYEQWVESGDGAVPLELRDLSGVNLDDEHQQRNVLFPLFRFNHAVIGFYLAQVVFPKAAKEFPEKLTTSGWDIAGDKTHVVTGFSGTSDNQYLLPTSIRQNNLPAHLGTNAKVLSILLQQENGRYLCPELSPGQGLSARTILDAIVQERPEVRVLLDVGAQILELRNADVVNYWLGCRRDIPAAIFFNDTDELVVMTQDSTTEPFIVSRFNQQLDKCLVYLDDAHTRGTDLKLPQNTRAAVTLGPKVTKDRLVQGCMRIRKLGAGQSVMFIAPREVDEAIRRYANKAEQGEVETLDILRWAMLETCVDIRHHVPHWVQQGVDYTARRKAWDEASSSTDMSSTLATAWLSPEARSLQDMYWDGFGHSNQSSLAEKAQSIPDIRERCEMLGATSLADPRVEEEQEREVNHEIEREEQQERPPKAMPAEHTIHEDIENFVLTGNIRRNSRAFCSPFVRLRDAAGLLELKERGPMAQLLATVDFLTSIQSTSETTGDYLRPIHWIVSGGQRDGRQVVVIFSPYEVNGLLPTIRASPKLHLHLYTPRTTNFMVSVDHLQLYCIPSLPSSWQGPAQEIIDRLNLCAGQLYLPDYDAYRRLCAFLGVCTPEDQERGVTVQSDGFIKPEHRDRALRANCNFDENPLPYLKALIGFRRKGMPFELTHVGKILHGRFLRSDDFRTTTAWYVLLLLMLEFD